MPITMNDLYEDMRRQAVTTWPTPMHIAVRPATPSPAPEPIPDWEAELLGYMTPQPATPTAPPYRQVGGAFDPDFDDFEDDLSFDDEIIWNPRTTTRATYSVDTTFATNTTNWVDILMGTPTRPPEPVFDHTPDMLDESAVHARVRVKGLDGDDWTGELATATSGDFALEFITEGGERMSFLDGDKIALLTTEENA